MTREPQPLIEITPIHRPFVPKISQLRTLLAPKYLFACRRPPYLPLLES